MTLKKTKEPKQPSVTGKIVSQEFFIGDIKVVVDPKSKSRVISIPFDFPSEEKGVLIVCKLKDDSWYPKKDISSITVNFNEN